LVNFRIRNNFLNNYAKLLLFSIVDVKIMTATGNATKLLVEKNINEIARRHAMMENVRYNARMYARM